MDILIKNATIIDGTGGPAFSGNVGVYEGKIVMNPAVQEADLVIDAAAKYLAPGFIDVHSHGDELIGGPSFGDLCKVNQGVTTQVAGQCGKTSAPTSAVHGHIPVISPESLNPELWQKCQEGISWSEYVEFMKRQPKVTNYKMFIGYNSIRTAVMGYDDRKPTEEEMNQMKAMVREAMEAGAAGISTGLAYVPATYSDTDEIVELAREMLPYGGIYATHMRNESWDLLASVEETIEIGRRSGVPVNISHFKVMGRRNWGNHRAAIDAIEKAREEGVDITCDQYPYNCSMTTYTPCMPPWHFSDGMDRLMEKLADAEYRETVKAEMLNPETDYENLFLNAGGWDGITICTSPNVPEAEGVTFSQYAANMGKDPFDAYFDLVIANRGAGTAVYHSISDDDIYDIIRLPYVMVGSDGIVNSHSEKCHPRGWGTMVRAISAFTKEQQILPLEELIHRMTGMSAERYSLKGKGLIQEGFDADLVLFDYENLVDCATYSNPTALAQGVECVMINGKIVYKDGALTGETPGRLL